MLYALVASRRHFYRKGALVNESFGPGWIFAILLVLISTAWLGFFSYKHVEYSSDLWWRFSFRADAPRFLRASVGVVGALLIFSIRHLLRPAAHEPQLPSAEELYHARHVLLTERNCPRYNALLGDKQLHVSAT